MFIKNCFNEDTLKLEIKTLKQIDCKYILNFENFCIKDLIIVFPRGDIDLGECIEKKLWYNAIDAINVLENGLRYCHSIGILHGDPKPENLLIISGEVKLIDFDLAAQIGDVVGYGDAYTPGFCHPALKDGGHLAAPIWDWFAAARTAWELLNRRFFDEKDETAEEAEERFLKLIKGHELNGCIFVTK